MSETKFTPGKWKVVQEDSHKFHEKTGEKTEFSRYWVRDENDLSITLFSNEYSHYPSPRDCARLVAAAPCMLKQLDDVLSLLLDLDQDHLNRREEKMVCDAIQEIESVLAKARGET